MVQAICAHFFSLFPSRTRCGARFLTVLVCPWVDFSAELGLFISSDRQVYRGGTLRFKNIYSQLNSQENPHAGLGWVACWVLLEPCRWKEPVSNDIYFHLGCLQKRVPKNYFSHTCPFHSKCSLLPPDRALRTGGKWMFQAGSVVLAIIYRMVFTVLPSGCKATVTAIELDLICFLLSPCD